MQTEEGRKKALKTVRERHGDDFYSRIGKKGSDSYLSKPKEERKKRGFAANPEIAKKAGAKGGRKSRRGKKEK